MTDEKLCLLARNGSERAIEELLRRWEDVIRLEASQVFARDRDEEDFRQVARLALAKAARTYDPRLSSFSYFAKLAIRRGLWTALRMANAQRHRALSRSARFEMQVEVTPGETVELAELIPGPSESEPAEILARREALREQIRVIHGCAPIERAVVRRYLNGCSLADAGEGLGASAQGAAKLADNALQRVRAKLRAAA